MESARVRALTMSRGPAPSNAKSEKEWSSTGLSQWNAHYIIERDVIDHKLCVLGCAIVLNTRLNTARPSPTLAYAFVKDDTRSR